MGKGYVVMVVVVVGGGRARKKERGAMGGKKGFWDSVLMHMGIDFSARALLCVCRKGPRRDAVGWLPQHRCRLLHLQVHRAHEMLSAYSLPASNNSCSV